MAAHSVRCPACGRRVAVGQAERDEGVARCSDCGEFVELGASSGGSGLVLPLVIGVSLLFGLTLVGVCVAALVWTTVQQRVAEMKQRADMEQAEAAREAERAAHLAARGAVAADADPGIRTDRLRQLGLAMHVHANQDRRSRLIPPPETDADGRAVSSWRVDLGRTTNAYEPNHLFGGSTRFLLVTGPGTLFDPENGGTLRHVEMAGRAASTIPLVIEVAPDRAVPFDSPQDFAFDPEDPKAGLGRFDGEEFLVLMADGSVRTFPTTISPAAFQVLVQMFPQLDAVTLEAVESELQDLGLPTQFRPERRKAEFEE